VSQFFNEETQEVELLVNQVVNQEAVGETIFRIPIEIAIHDEAGVTMHQIVSEEQSKSFIFPVTGAIKTIIFDNQHMLLANVIDYKPMEQFVNQFYLGKRYADRRDALLFGIAEEEPMSPEAEKMVLDALKDSFWAIRNIAIDRANLLSDESKNLAIEIIKNSALTDQKSAVRAAAITFLQDKIAAEELEKLALAIISKDQSYAVLSAALVALSSSNPELAMAEAKKLENENSSKMLSGIAQLYATQGTESEMAFFEKVINENKLNGLDALFAMNSMTIYLTRQSAELQSKVLGLYKKELANGGVYITMFLPQNVDYMIKMISDQAEITKAEITAYETNKNPLYADQSRKKLKQQQEIIAELSVFYAEINVEKQE
jgi:aminopeptidase N